MLDFLREIPLARAMIDAFKLPDLKRKIGFTMLILAIYRLTAHVPIPNVDPEALRQLFESNQLLGMLDIFSGGAMSSFSVMAMGVYPYITASIIMQLLMPIIPQLEEMAKEGEAGRQRINQYTHILTVPLAALQAYGQATLLQRSKILSNFGFVDYPLNTITTLATLTAGTIFAMWLGELITEQGIGNGISLIIFGGIVARVPQQVGSIITSSGLWILMVFIMITAITVGAIVIIQEGQRRIPVQYGKRVMAMRGNRLRVRGGQSTHIPLRVNSAGMIPLIFAQSIMIFPGVVASYFAHREDFFGKIASAISTNFSPQSDFYWIMYFFMVIGFTYFYTDVIFRQQNLPENLQRQGGFIPGIRPGRRTAEYLNGVLQRITLVGAVFLGLVAILPWIVRDVTETQTMLITSTGLLIVVGVVLDTMRQLEAQLLMRHYEGFIK
ncbi:MAG: preprotein translocase subunit SecY [Anaerolineae bacterium]